MKVEVLRIKTIENHPSADRLEIAMVEDYRCVVQKDTYKAGDPVVYIPTDAIVPEDILDTLGLTGRLAGSKKNRVKPIRLRGIFSEGIIYPLLEENGDLVYVNADVVHLVEEGQDVTELLGITKYEPVIPAKMSGDVYKAETGETIHYDIENFKRYPNVFEEGEEVVISEKCHGTLGIFGLMPDGEVRISSKGLSKKGLCLEESESNLYHRANRKFGITDKMREYLFSNSFIYDPVKPLFVLGEIFGKGIQDLDYDESLGFRIFDIYNGWFGKGYYLDYGPFIWMCDELGLDRVPVLYEGPYTKKVVDEYTSGHELISGKMKHIREGIVIKPTMERHDMKLGRVILKSKSEEYLTRKNGTELQ